MSLGELLLKFCNVGVPVLLRGSDCPTSIGLISFESLSVEPYETSVDSCVGKERDDLRLARNSSLRMFPPYGVRVPGFKLSGDVGLFVRSVTLL